MLWAQGAFLPPVRLPEVKEWFPTVGTAETPVEDHIEEITVEASRLPSWQTLALLGLTALAIGLAWRYSR